MAQAPSTPTDGEAFDRSPMGRAFVRAVTGDHFVCRTCGVLVRDHEGRLRHIAWHTDLEQRLGRP